MVVLHSLICNVPNLSKNVFTLRRQTLVLCLQKLHFTPIRWKSGRHDPDEAQKVPGAMSSQYEVFSEERAPVILDIEEERHKIEEIPEEETVDEWEGVNLERGVSGVFDIEELVDILRKEKAEDIFVAKISPEFRYADYLVVVTGRSGRHMMAMSEYIRRLFKRKMNKNDWLPVIEGKKSNTWIALDLGNIILHVFSSKTRELYDLETLWSVGKKYDSLSLEKETSTDKLFKDYANLLANLTPAK